MVWPVITLLHKHYKKASELMNMNSKSVKD